MSMASPAILPNFFEKQWTQNHPQYLSGLSRALYPTTFLEIAVSTLKHCCVLAHSVLIYIVTKWRITVRKNEKTVNNTHNIKANQHWLREYQETPFFCSLCLFCLFLLVVVFVLIESSFQAIQSTFRPLALHSKRRYKTCICSVILGKFESFRNCKGFGIVSSKSFKCTPFLFD